jgi:WD40 repeat protein
MPDIDQLYDIFIIYHPSDIRFVRRVDGHMKANGLRAWVNWEDLSNTSDGQALLKSGILRSHVVAIALSPQSAANQMCNELIQFAITHNKRFVTLIVDENIEIDVHPAIAENPYIYFRKQDEMEGGIQELLILMDIDDHLEMHTELLVYANDWDARNRNAGLLLPVDQVDEARKWLSDGATRQPKPSQLLVEYIHASRRQRSNRRWGISAYILMGLIILLLIGAVFVLLQSAQGNQLIADNQSTQAVIQMGTSEANAELAQSIIESATAEAQIIEDFSQTATSALALADMAVNSASTADAMQQFTQSQAESAISQASTAMTAQAEAQNLLIIAETESENSSTLAARVLTAEFESERLIETAQSAQADSLMIAQTATFVKVSADEQADIAQTQVANLATAESNATQQLATTTAVQLMSDSNASTAVAFAEIAETESNGRSTAEAELESITDTATQTFETAQEVNSQSLILSAEQALNAGDVDLALTLALSASESVEDSAQVYRILNRASQLSPLLILSDVSSVAFNPVADEIAVIPQTYDRVLILDAVTHDVKFELTEHEDDITTLKYSLDGRFLVTAGQDGMVIIWSTATGEPLHQLERHQGIVNAIAFHPDGQRMITAGIRPMLILWDINTGEELASYFAEFGDELLPNDLVFASDGSRIIGWSNPLGETIMSQWAGDTLDLLTGDSGGRVYIGYEPSGSLAWTGGRALPAYAGDPNVGELVLWNIATGQQQVRLTEGFNWTVLSGGNLASSTDSLLFTMFADNDSVLLGVQGSDGGQRVVRVNITDGTIQRTYQNNVTAQITSAYAIDEDRILSPTRDNRLVLWSLDSGELIREVGISTRALQEIDVSHDGRFALVQASGGEAYLWSIIEPASALSQVLSSAITGTSINQTGDRVLVASDSNIILQNTETQQAVVTFDTASLTRMNDTGTHFAVLSDNQVVVIDARTGIEQKSWSITSDDISKLIVSPTGGQAFINTVSGDVWLMRSDTDGAIPLNMGNITPPFGMIFNRDGSTFMTLHAESAIQWETSTASEIQRFPLGLPVDGQLDKRVKVAFGEASDSITFFVQLDNNLAGLTRFQPDSTEVNRQTLVDVVYGELSSDGAYLLLALTDNSIQIVDTASGDILRRLIGHTDTVQTLMYQPENDLLFSGSDDNNLIVWDTEQGVMLHQYNHPADVVDLSVSEDGQRVLSRAGDGMVRLWQRETSQQLLSRIKTAFTVRDLTCAEREQYRVLPLCD